MTKSKRFVSRMMFALLVLTLVSFCFVGFTFARYTTDGSQAADAAVALWKITGEFKNKTTEGDTTVIHMDKLSPSMAPYTSTVRTNDTAKEALVITNGSDVKAEVTLEVVNVKVNYVDGVSSINGLTVDQILRHFTITLTKDANGTAFDKSAGDLTLDAKNGDVTDSLTVYAYVVWTSDLAEDTTNSLPAVTGDAADKEDTLIGENVKSISFDIKYTAVQASELPTA